ncbi:MAG: CPBP family intramembrane metalloprotease [Firmicutes bacterium]|jgi:membrane protease YdiL (CAAX protease family)|nr:CPBP family intramembrane metalloprotease [Bacillota bacterium]
MVKGRLCNPDKPLHCSLAFIALFLVQVFAGKSGWFVADLFSYDSFDPDHLFARLSVHHIVQMLIALAIITVLSKLIKADFGFQLGDSKKGLRYFLIFTAVIAVIALIYHIPMYVFGQGQAFDFPLNPKNVLGTLGFQLFLSGTSEEILYRALPVTVLVYVFGKNIQIKWDITLEVVLASFLFTVAHIKWSLFPFSADFNLSQLFYAFAMGTVSGIVYQQSRSILYPMLMHSISNVLMVGTGYLFAVLL